MLWWCHTGKASFTTSSSSLLSTACSKGKLWHHNLSTPCSFSEPSWWNFIFGPCRKSYRSLGLLWAGSSIAHQIVLIPGVVIGERCWHATLWFITLSVFYVAVSVDDVLVCPGKYGSNILPAFWRNIPFFLVPFWAASLLFSRPRVMPIITADKVSFRSRKYWREVITKCNSFWFVSYFLFFLLCHRGSTNLCKFTWMTW